MEKDEDGEEEELDADDEAKETIDEQVPEWNGGWDGEGQELDGAQEHGGEEWVWDGRGRAQEWEDGIALAQDGKERELGGLALDEGEALARGRHHGVAPHEEEGGAPQEASNGDHVGQ